jgi:hypothetical protein
VSVRRTRWRRGVEMFGGGIGFVDMLQCGFLPSLVLMLPHLLHLLIQTAEHYV